jgi:isoleucyl-tRNA synthetase
MSKGFQEHKELNLVKVASVILDKWDAHGVFEKSISSRSADKPFVFFEGPPSANGMPGIHHVMARAIKDIFCRYKTLKGFQVKRKAGWDTHGLPIELGVEKELGITKEDIGKTISVEEYNAACRKAVMRYTDVWNDLTRRIGYWVNMDDPYITYENKYIESVWWLLAKLYNDDMLYKGYTIQPYSPKAGTGLSSHELNQPGTYQDVKDTTVVAQFEVKAESLEALKGFMDADSTGKSYFIAWTTTPWTLPSNTALCVGPKIDYVVVNTTNRYTEEPCTLVMAEALVAKLFPEKEGLEHTIVGRCKGTDLVGMKYEQLLPYTQPMDSPEEAFRVIQGDFVTTEDGTGIVHIAPTFGADDMKVGKDAGVPPMLVDDGDGNGVPLVDLQGRFRPEMAELAGKYVKNEYYNDGEAPERSVDVEIAIRLKEESKAFKVEKYAHSYPHCWRTDKPILYYPLDSWFVRTTRVKDRMVELNNTINWKPESTGTGRFGNWLENVNDWNLSRSRYWGIPIPIWRSEDGKEAVCIGSVEQLYSECEKAVAAGIMDKNPIGDFAVGDMSTENYKKIDLHKNWMDDITLVSDSGKPLQREADLIDVWFDSGSMPYAQWHYPFENKELIDSGTSFPADFIAEGVDQTRGWFYTLHAIGTMCFDSVAYKNVVSNGLVLDKKGLKMSKRLGNATDPFEMLDKHGPDATRWYMITNAQPWDNLKFDEEGIAEVKRKFFGTLYNTYGFLALYANVDKFDFSHPEIAIEARPEIDRWIISKLNTLIGKVDKSFDEYEPTRAGRAIQEFVNDQLSNWYVRLCRRRFWKGEMSEDKVSAYQTLFTCLETCSRLMAPIAPFYSDQLYSDLHENTAKESCESVHLDYFPTQDQSLIDGDLEKRMEIAQKISSLVLSLRRKESMKVRQPLGKIMVPILDPAFEEHLRKVEDLILSEVNVKELEYLHDSTGVLVKQAKPNFKSLGPKYGKIMKAIAAEVNGFSQERIAEFETAGGMDLSIDGQAVTLTREDVEIVTQDIPGWSVQTDGEITVALDVTLNEDLKFEGIAREFVNRIQNLRKDSGLEVTDKINLKIQRDDRINEAVESNIKYICSETLAVDLVLQDTVEGGTSVDLDEQISTTISIEKLN